MNDEQEAIRDFTTFVHGQDAHLLMTPSDDPDARLRNWTNAYPSKAATMVSVLREWAILPMTDEHLTEMLYDAEAAEVEVQPENVRSWLANQADMIEAELTR